MPSRRRAEVLSTADAAKLLGLSADMVRLLARHGRLPVASTSKSGVRMFRKSDVEALLDERRGRPHVDHRVQFYDKLSYLAQVVSDFLAPALLRGVPCAIIATRRHRDAFVKQLSKADVDIGAAQRSGILVLLDAERTLDGFGRDGRLDLDRFHSEVCLLLDRLASPRGRPLLYGEMVSVLWDRGYPDAAIELEHQWCLVNQQRSFGMLCAYPMRQFESSSATERFERIVGHHSHVSPSEGVAESNDRRDAALLEQKARALDAEIARRERAEERLRSAEARLRQLETKLARGARRA